MEATTTAEVQQLVLWSFGVNALLMRVAREETHATRSMERMDINSVGPTGIALAIGIVRWSALEVLAELPREIAKT